MQVGKQIARIRKERGMSQEQFGQYFHVTRQTVSNWENSKSYPDLETLVKMSELFDVTLDSLLKGDTPMVQTIDWERRMGKWFKRLFVAVGIVLLLLNMILPAVIPHVTPEKLRNVSEGTERQIVMYLNFPNNTPSRAIVRTFLAEAYDSFSEKKLKKIQSEIYGRIEGDAPAVHLQKTGGKIWVVFQDQRHRNIMLDGPPEIRLEIRGYDSLQAKPLPHNKLEPVIFLQSGTMTPTEYGYLWWIESPFDDPDHYVPLQDKPNQWGLEICRYVEPCYVEVRYQIGGVRYVSVTFCNVVDTLESEER